MKLLTDEQHAQLLDNGRRQDPVRGTAGEIDFCPVVKLFTPDAAARSAPAWVLQSVLYCLSLSSLLLGLSAAHGDAEEFPVLFTQFAGRATWLAGKNFCSRPGNIMDALASMNT